MQPSVHGMEFDRGSPLRIRNVNVAHRCRDYRVAEDALHLGQMNACFQKIGSAAMTELMKTVEWRLGITRDGMHTVADSERRKPLAVTADEQCRFIQPATLFELVVALR